NLGAESMGVKERVDSVIKSEEDQRQYRALILENELKVLLISDTTTDKSAAALDVHIVKLRLMFSHYKLLSCMMP
ncbi:hypothetical protein SK128_000792, partial [Halocaridina rubra]